MSFDPDRVRTVTFDSYGTLVDVDAAEAALAEHVEEPETVSRRWRTRSLEYTFVATQIDAYQPFYEILRDALQYALAERDESLSTDEREDVLGAYHELDVFDDVGDGFERLATTGYEPYVLSNGNPEMLRSMVEHAGIDEHLADAISADEVRTFKPDPAVYRHAAARTGTPIEEIAHVTAGWFDVQGANSAGMQSVWLDRNDAPWEPFDGDPDLVIQSVGDLADELR